MDLVRTSSGGWAHAENAVVAAMRLEQATGIVRGLHMELADVFASDPMAADQLTRLLGQLVRMGRYERRFRGQRDRALRALLVGSSAI